MKPLIQLILVCFALVPLARAVVPPPGGGYPNFTTAEGQNALQHLTTGAANTAVGWHSLFTDTSGSFNTGVGAGTLVLNTADSNTATGVAALLLNITGTQNTANGTAALVNNSSGSFNSAFGAFTLNANIDGSSNTATGAGALFSNSTGENNTAVGTGALSNNTGGDDNTAVGISALLNTTGSDNIAVGGSAGGNLTTGSNNIDIGNFGVGGESGTIRIGNQATQTATYIAGISGATASGGVQVFVDTAGKLGTLTSSARFKEEIKPMDQASEAILAFKPVTFRYKKEIDPKSTPQFGLVAEDVAKVNPDLVTRDAKGELYTVRYEAVNAMLLNEFLKEHKAFIKEQRKVNEQGCKIQKQEATITQLKNQVEALVAQAKGQDSRIQRITAKLESVVGARLVSVP